MSVKIRPSRQIDLLLLCSAFIGAVLPARIGAIAAEKKESHNVSSLPRWKEEALMAQGEKIELESASVPGLELIEGVGHSLATSIIFHRKKLQDWCTGGSGTGGGRTGQTKIINTTAPGLELKALEGVPGVGPVRSEAILKYVSICGKS